MKDIQCDIALVSPEMMQLATTTKSPQGVAALIKKPKISIPKNPKFILVLDNISNPENMGGLIRTAVASGVDLIIALGREGCDPYNPKVLRGAMGATFKVPILFFQNWNEAYNLLKLKNIKIIYV